MGWNELRIRTASDRGTRQILISAENIIKLRRLARIIKNAPFRYSAGPVLTSEITGEVYQYWTVGYWKPQKPRLTKPGIACKVDGCSSNSRQLGYCQKHAQRFRKYGDPLILRGRKVNGSE